MATDAPKEDCLEALVPIQCHGMRLDQVAAELFPDYSRNRLATWIKEGRLTVDGRTVKPRDKATASAKVTLIVTDEPVIDWQPQSLPLDIIFEDEHILVVNKPAGVVVHPAAGHADGTLVNALLAHAPELDALPRGGIVHRLDKDTSGLMVVAKSENARLGLIDQLVDHSLHREYLAVVNGRVISGNTVEEPIGRDKHDRRKMAVSMMGKEAVTHYRVDDRYRNHTLLRVQLETGRTHQIRVHSANMGCPLIGDFKYGYDPELFARKACALTV